MKEIKIKKDSNGTYQAFELAACRCGDGTWIDGDLNKDLLKQKLKDYYNELGKGLKTPIKFKIIEEDE